MTVMMHIGSGFLLINLCFDIWTKDGRGNAKKNLHWINFVSVFLMVVIWLGTVCLIKMWGRPLDNLAQLLIPQDPSRRSTTANHTSITSTFESHLTMCRSERFSCQYLNIFTWKQSSNLLSCTLTWTYCICADLVWLQTPCLQAVSVLKG